MIIDPLYRGLAEIDTTKLAEMGDAIVQFAKACHPASLIMSHHTTKSSAREYGMPPALEDMSGAGLAESCGCWWLLGRNGPYNHDRKHDLCVQYGGRDEQSGLRRILFDEEKWAFEIQSMEDFKADQQQSKEIAKQEARRVKLNEARAGVKHCLANIKEAKPKTWIEVRSGSSQRLTRQAIAELLNDGTLAASKYRDSRNVERDGYLLASLVSLVSPVNETCDETV